MGSTEIVFRFLMIPHRVLGCMKETKKREKRKKERKKKGPQAAGTVFSGFWIEKKKCDKIVVRADL